MGAEDNKNLEPEEDDLDKLGEEVEELGLDDIDDLGGTGVMFVPVTFAVNANLAANVNAAMNANAVTTANANVAWNANAAFNANASTNVNTT